MQRRHDFLELRPPWNRHRHFPERFRTPLIRSSIPRRACPLAEPTVIQAASRVEIALAARPSRQRPRWPALRFTGRSPLRVFSALAGVFTNPQFQSFFAQSTRRRASTSCPLPKVTAKSGQTAKISIVREFKYPTQFDPPQIPQTVSSGFTPVTPTTPSAFDTRPLGVELEVQPTIGPDGYTIDLNLSPRVTEFDGFINYGSPIYATARQVTRGLDSVTTGLTTVVGYVSRLGRHPPCSFRKIRSTNPSSAFARSPRRSPSMTARPSCLAV